MTAAPDGAVGQPGNPWFSHHHPGIRPVDVTCVAVNCRTGEYSWAIATVWVHRRRRGRPRHLAT